MPCERAKEWRIEKRERIGALQDPRDERIWNGLMACHICRQLSGRGSEDMKRLFQPLRLQPSRVSGIVETFAARSRNTWGTHRQLGVWPTRPRLGVYILPGGAARSMEFRGIVSRKPARPKRLRQHPHFLRATSIIAGYNTREGDSEPSCNKRADPLISIIVVDQCTAYGMGVPLNSGRWRGVVDPTDDAHDIFMYKRILVSVSA